MPAKRGHQLIGLLASLVLLAGCQFPIGAPAPEPQTPPTPTIQPTASTPTAGEFFAYLESDAVVTAHTGSGELSRIPASAPSAVAWMSDQELVWAEALMAANASAPTGYLLMQRAAAGGELTQLHWTREPITQLTVAPQGELLAFVQENDLFVLSIESGRVTRVAEDVLDFSWSPELPQLLVRTAEAARLLELSANAAILVDHLVFTAPEAQISGLAWRDRLSVVAFRYMPESNRVELVQYQIRQLGEDPAIILDWRAGPTEGDGAALTDAAEALPIPYYEALASPNGNLLAVAEWEEGSDLTRDAAGLVSRPADRLSTYSFATDRRTELPDAALLHSWQDNQLVRIAKITDAAIIGGRYDLYGIQTVLNQREPIAQAIPYPVFPPAH